MPDSPRIQPTQKTTDLVSISALHRLPSPQGLHVLARWLGAAFVVLLLTLWLAPWQQNIPGTGRVAALTPFDRAQTIAAPVDGRVRESWVVEGSRVEAGDLLLEIVDNDPEILERLSSQRVALDSQLASTEERVLVYEKQIEALERARSLATEAARRQVDVARAATRSARHGLEGARAAEQQANLNHRRNEELLRDGLVSEFEFEVARRTHEESRARVAQARQELDAALNDEAARKADLGQVDTRAEAEVEAARAERESAEVAAAALRERIAGLETRIAQQSTQRISAPRAGTVFRVYAAPGAELVKAGDPLVELIPDTTRRAVELWVDGNHVPLIEEGRPVRLQFEGWPAVQFAGWPSVAVGTFGGRVELVDPSDDGRGRFRLLVVPDDLDAPWPDSKYLRQGMRAKGFVLLDQVSLGYELWRQANGFPPIVAPSGDGSDGTSSASSEERAS